MILIRRTVFPKRILSPLRLLKTGYHLRPRRIRITHLRSCRLFLRLNRRFLLLYLRNRLLRLLRFLLLLLLLRRLTMTLLLILRLIRFHLNLSLTFTRPL